MEKAVTRGSLSVQSTKTTKTTTAAEASSPRWCSTQSFNSHMDLQPSHLLLAPLSRLGISLSPWTEVLSAALPELHRRATDTPILTDKHLRPDTSEHCPSRRNVPDFLLICHVRVVTRRSCSAALASPRHLRKYFNARNEIHQPATSACAWNERDSGVM